MIICFDLDGTLYDTLPSGYALVNKLLERHGCKKIPLEKFRTLFHSHDWIALYESFGFSKEDAIIAVKEYYVEHEQKVDPGLISGAEELLNFSEELVGKDNVFVITNERKEIVKFRFERDGITRFLRDLRSADSGKSHLFEDLAKIHHTKKIIYVGDLISDGEDCKTVRKKGFDMQFIAIANKHSFNTKEVLQKFVEENSEWSHLANDYEELKEILKQLK